MTIEILLISRCITHLSSTEQQCKQLISLVFLNRAQSAVLLSDSLAFFYGYVVNFSNEINLQ